MDPKYDPYQPPAASISEGRQEYHAMPMKLASRTRRFANYWIDSALAFVPVFIFMFVGVLVDSVLGQKVFHNFMERTDYYATLLPFAGYYMFFEALWQRTPAKWITRTIVVTEDGRKPSFTEILSRTAVRFVPFESLSFLGKSSLGWHDKWSKTRVIIYQPGAAGAGYPSSNGPEA